MGKLKKQPKKSNTKLALDEIKTPRTLKLTDKVWSDLTKLKSRDDKSWDLFFKELMDHLNYIKNL